jgi:hypothetical protein
METRVLRGVKNLLELEAELHQVDLSRRHTDSSDIMRYTHCIALSCGGQVCQDQTHFVFEKHV